MTNPKKTIPNPSNQTRVSQLILQIGIEKVICYIFMIVDTKNKYIEIANEKRMYEQEMV